MDLDYKALVNEALFRASAFINTGNYEDAMPLLEQILKVNPKNHQVLSYLSICYKAMDRKNDAIKLLEKAIQIDPRNANYYSNMGMLYHEEGNFNKAIAYLDYAVALNPEFYAAYNNLAIVYLSERILDKAEDYFIKAIAASKLKNDLNFCAKIYYNMGNLCSTKNEFKESIEWYNKNLEITPNDTQVHWNSASSYLVIEEYKKGWEEYEWRFKQFDNLKRWKDRLGTPAWEGENLKGTGKTLLLFGEQGTGDTLQFLRFIPQVKKLVDRLVLIVGKELVEILKRSFPDLDEVYADSEANPPHDYNCSVLSFGKILKIYDSKEIPNEPYLQPIDYDVSSMFKEYNNDFKIGIAWAGNPMHQNDFNRSCPLEHFKIIQNIPGVKLFSLQKNIEKRTWGNQLVDLTNQSDDMSIVDIRNLLETWDHTACILQNLDLIICVDTSLAHFTGAIGKECWTLLPFSPDWRWSLKRPDDTFWYQNMRLFRQPSYGEWKAVFVRVAEELSKLPKIREMAKKHVNVKQKKNKNREFSLLITTGQDKVAELINKGDYVKAQLLCKQILRLSSNNGSAYSNLGVCYHKTGDTKLAIQSFKKAIKLDNVGVIPRNNLAALYGEIGEYDKAIETLKEVIALDSSYAHAYNNLGTAYDDVGDLKSAIASFEKSIQLDDKSMETHFNLANSLARIGEFEKAINHYSILIKMTNQRTPLVVDSLYNSSLLYLLKENFTDGLSLYEWRLGLKQNKDCRVLPMPIWKGLESEGSIFIHSEQGIGDTIQFMRYLPMVKEKGFKEVIFECQPEVYDLINNYTEFGIDKIIKRGDPIPYVDFHRHLMSLPNAFNTTISSIPNTVPYVKPKNNISYEIDKNLFNIGICWSPGRYFEGMEDLPKKHPQYSKSALTRHVPISYFRKLNLKGIKLHSLQKGAGRSELYLGDSIVDNGGKINNWNDTADIINQLDLVIAVDTGVLHLAGAIGKEVWGLLPYYPEWRWLEKRQDSPWYPSMKLFRQTVEDSWDEVFQELKLELKNKLI